MPKDFDHHSHLWTPAEPGHFFRDIRLEHRRQVGGSCVSTGLGLLTREEPAAIRGKLNTQDPVTWSRYLRSFGMKLAYCPTDLRRLRHYMDEILRHDDLFAVGTYSPSDPREIGGKPDSSGWICGSHFVLIHRDTVHDTRHDQPVKLAEYEDLDRYVKRIFRVVPADHERGL